MWRAPWREWDLLTSPAARQPGREIAPSSPSETKAEHRGTLPLLGGRVPGSAENRCSNTVSRVKAPGSAVRTAERPRPRDVRPLTDSLRRRAPRTGGAIQSATHGAQGKRRGQTDAERKAPARGRVPQGRVRVRCRAGRSQRRRGGGGGGTGGDHVLVRGTPGAMR